MNFRVVVVVEVVAMVVVVLTVEEAFSAGTSFQTRTCGHYSTAVFGAPSVVSCQSLGPAGPGNRRPNHARATVALLLGSHQISKTVAVPVVLLLGYICSNVLKYHRREVPVMIKIKHVLKHGRYIFG